MVLEGMATRWLIPELTSKFANGGNRTNGIIR